MLICFDTWLAHCELEQQRTSQVQVKGCSKGERAGAAERTKQMRSVCMEDSV